MKQLTISYFGCLDKKYSRNKTNIDGLRQAGVTVNEVIVQTPVTPLNSQSHIGAMSLVKRILRKFLIIPVVIKNRKIISKSDAIFVGYPGQFDVPFAYLTAKLFRKKLVFDPVILMFNALSNDIGVIAKDDITTRILKKFEEIIMNLPDLVIASTVEQKQFFIEKARINPAKILVAYLAADDQIYKPSQKQKTADRFNAVYYGLYTPLHGVPHLIKASKLCQQQKSIVFQFVGKGQLYEECQRHIEREGITNIELYPDITEANASTLLEEADVFFGFMESNETALREIPNKVYQGIAMGKVVITSESPAINSVFHNKKDIYLVPPADGKAIADAIIKLSEDQDLVKSISDNAYRLFISNFTPKAIGEEMKSALITLTA